MIIRIGGEQAELSPPMIRIVLKETMYPTILNSVSALPTGCHIIIIRRQLMNLLLSRIVLASIFGLIITSIVWAVVQAADSINNQTERQEKISRLLAVLAAKVPSIPVPEEIEKSRDMAKRKQYFEEMHRKFQQIEEKYEQARNELAAMGDDVVAQLFRDISKWQA